MVASAGAERMWPAVQAKARSTLKVCGEMLGATTLAFIFFLTVACGYRFQGEAKLPSGAQTLCVELFENRTNIAGLEAIVANGLVFEFTKHSRIVLLSDVSRADLIMRGTIRSGELRTVAPRNKDAAGERRVTLTLDVRLAQPNGKVVWSANGLSDSEVYVVSDEKIFNEEKERATLSLLAGRIGEKIFNRFTDDF